jgi:hypothetical protein
MNKETLKQLIGFLKERVIIETHSEESHPIIKFNSPSREIMVEAGFEIIDINQILDTEWYGDMVNDIEETPEFSDPDDTHSQILDYAKDVIAEYLMKRVQIKTTQ